MKEAEKINNLSRGFEIKVDSSTKSISLHYLTGITGITDSKNYESTYYKEVYGPIHMENGYIFIDNDESPKYNR